MIKYGICTNQGYCSIADSSTVTKIEGVREFVCPECHEELFEVKEPKTDYGKWVKPVLVICLLGLIAGLIYFFWPSSLKAPLSIKVLGLDCQTGVLSLTTTGGNGDSVTYKVEGIGQDTFTIPDSLRHDSMLLIYASQGGNTVDTTFTTSCVTTPEPTTLTVGGGQSTTVSTGNRTPPPITIWTRVPGSEFCEPGTCMLLYSETDNLGHTRERKINNFAKCCPVEN
jgi:hypothetical protein